MKVVIDTNVFKEEKLMKPINITIHGHSVTVGYDLGGGGYMLKHNFPGNIHLVDDVAGGFQAIVTPTPTREQLEVYLRQNLARPRFKL
jgi:hypothetical protein